MIRTSGPVTSSERITSIDVLRGVALLGILTMNILSLGLPSTARLNPNVAGGFTGINWIAWLVGYFLFDEKMITIFSMLFGAGLVLMTARSNQQGRLPAHLYFRRMGILLLIGLIHAYLIWDGDILVSYAILWNGGLPAATALSPNALDDRRCGRVALGTADRSRFDVVSVTSGSVRSSSRGRAAGRPRIA